MVCRMAFYKVKPTVACTIPRSNFLFFKAKITCGVEVLTGNLENAQNVADFLDKIMPQNKDIETMSNLS